MAKILIYTLVFHPDQVSTSYMLCNLVRGLKKFGHDITVLTTTPHYHPSEQSDLFPYLGKWIYKSDFEGVPCYHIKVPEKKGGILARIVTSFLFHLRSFCFARRSETDCDLVLSITPPPTMGLVGARIARRHKAGSLFVIGDLLSENFITVKRTGKSPVVRFLRLIERWSYLANDAIVTVTQSSTDLIRSRAPERCTVETITDSVDTDLYIPHSRDNEYSREHGWNDKFVVTYVGNMGKAQDFSAIPDVVTRCSDLPVKFVFAGSGLKCENLAEEAKTLGNPAWEVWGHQPLATTAWINSSSDLCLVLLSSNITKGSFPSKLYTIMACARPVLYYGPCDTDIGRLIREKGIGWTVETGDVDGFEKAIREAYEKPELLKEMGRRALEEVKDRYSAEAVAKQYDKLIRRLLNEHSYPKTDI